MQDVVINRRHELWSLARYLGVRKCTAGITCMSGQPYKETALSSTVAFYQDF